MNSLEAAFLLIYSTALFIYIRYPSHGGSLSHWVWQRAFHKHSGKIRIVRIEKRCPCPRGVNVLSV